MSDAFTEAQWIDRFANRLGALLPAVGADDATRIAVTAYRQASELDPDEAAEVYALDMPLRDSRIAGDDSPPLRLSRPSLTVPGASEAELARGLAVADAIFRDANVSWVEGARAVFNRERLDMWEGLPPEESQRLTDEEHRAAQTWDQAEDQGLAACCADWPEVPEGAYMELIDGVDI